MPEFLADPIREVPKVPESPHEGTAFKPTDELVEGLICNGEWDSGARRVVDTMLSASGLSVEWVENDNRYQSGDFTPDKKQAMAETFDQKKSSVSEIYDASNEMLPSLKNELSDSLSKYAASLGIDPDLVRKTVDARIEPVKEVKVEDLLTQGKVLELVGGVAHFEHSQGELRVVPDRVIENANDLGLTSEQQLRRDLLHELMHAGSFRAEDAKIDYVTRSGLSAMASIGEKSETKAWTGKSLLDEGAQEHIRWKHLDGAPPSYEKSVMFWEMAIALDPSIEADRFNAKFFNENRGVMIGKLEHIFGPAAVEIVESDLNTYNRLRDYPEWKDKIVGMIEIYDEDPDVRMQKTEEARQRAREILDATQQAIYETRGMNHSDEELRYLKKHGKLPAVDVENNKTES